MKTTLSKITIVSERLLKAKLISLIKREGATGFTITAAEGEGSRGVRASEWEGRNIRIETLVAHDVAERILTELNERYFEDYAVVAWISDVAVLRGDKFLNQSSQIEPPEASQNE